LLAEEAVEPQFPGLGIESIAARLEAQREHVGLWDRGALVGRAQAVPPERREEVAARVLQLVRDRGASSGQRRNHHRPGDAHEPRPLLRASWRAGADGASSCQAATAVLTNPSPSGDYGFPQLWH